MLLTKGDIPVEFITVIQGIVILLVAAEEVHAASSKKNMIYKAAEELADDKKKEVKEILEESDGKENRYVYDRMVCQFWIFRTETVYSAIFAGLAAVISKKPE